MPLLSIVYGAAVNTSLDVHVCIGAINSTPINAILIETSELPLKLRRERLALAYWIRLKGSGKENPTKEMIKDCWEYSRF